MRIAKLAILLILLVQIPSAPAGVLTRGNVFAESLAGCSYGMGIGLMVYLFLEIEDPLIGSVAAANVGLIGSCLVGAAIAATTYGLAGFLYKDQDFIDVNGVLDNKIPMVYPEIPGKVLAE